MPRFSLSGSAPAGSAPRAEAVCWGKDPDSLQARLIDKPRWHVPVDQRSCANHPASRAVDRCDRCGQPFCALCLQQLQRWRVCRGCVALFGREELATRLPSRWQRAKTEILAGVAILLALPLVFLLIQAAIGKAGSNANLFRSAEVVGGKLNGAAGASRIGTLRLTTNLAGPVPTALHIIGTGFAAAERVSVTTELDGPGALIGSTAPGQEGVKRFAPITTMADAEGRVSVLVPLPAGTVIPATYRVQVTATGNKGTFAALDQQGSATPAAG